MVCIQIYHRVNCDIHRVFCSSDVRDNDQIDNLTWGKIWGTVWEGVYRRLPNNIRH